MKIRIGGKQWALGFYSKEHMGRDLGGCDPPSRKGKEIYILDTLRGRIALDTILHECLHAASWAQFDEAFVDRLATDLSKVVFNPVVLARILDDPAVKEVLNVSHGPHREVEAEAAPREAGVEEAASGGTRETPDLVAYS